MRRVCGFEAQLKEFNGESDHVHLLIECPPKLVVSKLVNRLKGVSAGEKSAVARGTEQP